MSWKIKVGIFRGPSPRWAGNRNIAVLCRTPENTLVLDTGHGLPDIVWLVLVTITAVLGIVNIVLSGNPTSVINLAGLISFFAISVLIVWSRPQLTKLDLGSAVSEVIIDDKRSRIALLMPVDQKPSWIVLSDFGYSFSEVSAAIRDVVDAKCRPGPITEGSWLPLIIVSAAVAAWVLAFGFCMFCSMY